MSDARGFLVAAYLLTAVTLLWYGVHLARRAREVGRHLAAAREEARRPHRDGAGVRDAEPEPVGGRHVQA